MDEGEQARLLELASGFQRHIRRWRRAVALQDWRVRSHPWAAGRPDRAVDTEFLAVSLRTLLRACWACHRCFDRPTYAPFQEAMNAFEVAVPYARVIRDRRQRFDRYDADDHLDVFISLDEAGDWQVGSADCSLLVNEVRLDLAAAVRASELLAAAALRALDYIGFCLEHLGGLPSWPEGDRA
jgi:hypothetical protein